MIEAIEIQVEGSKKMNAKDYLRGHKLRVYFIGVTAFGDIDYST